MELCPVECRLRGCHISQQRIQSSVFGNGVLLPFKDDGATAGPPPPRRCHFLSVRILLALCVSVISGEEWDKYYAGDVRACGPRILTTSLPLPVMVKGSAWILQEKNIWRSDCREEVLVSVSPCLILSFFLKIKILQAKAIEEHFKVIFKWNCKNNDCH